MTPDQFNFLVVPLGVIVGLSLAHIAITLTHYVQHRDNIQFYWVLIAWTGILFVYILQTWYVLYSWQTFGESFIKYLYFLVNPMLAYCAVVLLLPRSEENKHINQKEHYFLTHRWFFAIGCIIMINRIILETIVDGQNLFELSDWPRFAGIILFGVLAVVTNRLVHEVMTIISAILLVIFIAINSPSFTALAPL